jgi:hypothetical protein
MIQRGDGSRFALEALREIFIGDFDRDIAPQPGVAGAVTSLIPPAPMEARIS